MSLKLSQATGTNFEVRSYDIVATFNRLVS